MEADATRLRLIALVLAVASMGLVALALLLGAGGLDAELIVVLRAPRVAAAAGVGALLALAGLAMQVLLRNPLADPYVLGTSGGAAMGALLALSLGLSLAFGAALGALLAAGALLLIARRALAASDDASARLILSGAMLAALFGAAVSLLLTITPDQRLRGAIFWLVGDLSGASGGVWCLLGAALLVLALLARQRSVDRLLIGSEAAALLGEPVRRLRLELLVAAALATALAVATAGAVGFVGLVVPQTLRLLGVQRTRWLAPLSALGGAALLIGADLLARLVAAPMELPVGAVMALIGAPVFIVLLARPRS
ncbi:FecCD family ABC transporter permease [Rivibacter subsaxonicus]|uniref:Iron complex transport system permease protein n=1 Tax=Rivibacter subsaxonicus TaxID=457575 RepID=A0A4Q7VMU4_9BURK|nr:iron chelate uptake ABC transporter family permease subunit [Rivibacter subsaxonicus]RZT97656.1 iron complex transport system permease protein [Rivibacter subsaxonicus]